MLLERDWDSDKNSTRTGKDRKGYKQKRNDLNLYDTEHDNDINYDLRELALCYSRLVSSGACLAGSHTQSVTLLRERQGVRRMNSRIGSNTQVRVFQKRRIFWIQKSILP